MSKLPNRSVAAPGLLAVAILFALGAAGAARASMIAYEADLDGLSQSPPNASPGTGHVLLEIDDAAHTMHVAVTFQDLLGTSTAAHVHGPTASAGTGTAGVITTLPTFAGFPLGVTSGIYDNTLDLTQASSWNPGFITANGGTTAGAEAALLQSLADGTAYFNLHTNRSMPGGRSGAS